MSGAAAQERGFVLATCLMVIAVLSGMVLLATVQVRTQTLELAHQRDALQARASCYRRATTSWQSAAPVDEWVALPPDELGVTVRYRLSVLTAEHAQAEVLCEKNRQQTRLALAIHRGAVVGRYEY